MHEFHLHPEGSDQNDGLSARPGKGRRGPWATFEGARDALRRLRAEGTVSGDVAVHVHSGRYPIAAPVEFGAEDSRTAFVAVEEGGAVVDGGVPLEGWRETEENGRRAWVLDLPDVAAGRWRFRSLFVNGERRPRARLPKFSPDAQGVRNVFRIGEIRFPEKRKLFDGDSFFKPRPGDLQPWPSLPDSEIVLLHYWIETRLGRPRLDPRTGWIECERRSVFNLYESFGQELARYYIDNLREALTEPGEWYLDYADGRLIYLPKTGERIGQTPIFAPRVTAFIRASGAAFNHDEVTRDPFGGRPLRELRFQGIAFRHADWFHPMGEMLAHNRLRLEDRPLGSSPQAGSHVPAAIEFRRAEGCALERCAIEHIGFNAVAFGPGCRDGAVRSCRLRDLGAGGVRMDGVELDGSAADRTGDIVVEDNSILDFGRVFHQGVGVLLMRAYGCRVAHNEIARGCYTGISCGWSWGYRDTITHNNLLENNLIHDIGQGVLSDMGGIYLLGAQPGTVVRGNHIYGVESAAYGGWGIYPDEGSSHILVEHNWVHDLQGAAFRMHFGRELVVRDNVFAATREEALVGIGRQESHTSATLMHNVLLGPAPALYQGGYSADVRFVFRTDANLIGFSAGAVPPCRNADHCEGAPKSVSFREWQKVGHDRHSVVADPRARVVGRNLVFPANSPAFKVGFRPYDWSVCGPRRTPPTAK